MIKKTVFFILSLLLLAVCGCHSETVKTEYSCDFYELCFYFQKLPAGALQSDVEAASEIYSGYLSGGGIKVLGRKSTLLKSCWFLDREPDLSGFSAGNTENGVSEYILNASFKQGNASLYGVKNSGRTTQKIYDEIPLNKKIRPAETFESGAEVRGTAPKMLYFSRYLDNLDIKNSFGTDSENRLLLSVPEDSDGRWKIFLFLYDALDFENIFKPVPGDFAIISWLDENLSETTVRKSGWKKMKVEKTGGRTEKNSIKFKFGAMNIPFSEEAVVKYLYSLAYSHRLPFESDSLYSPNFASSSVIPQLYLFSAGLEFSENVPNPEHLFMWVVFSERQLETYPDTFYANLLSLKIAKKLVSGDKIFLGGKDLENKKLFVPSEKIRETLFTAGNVAVSGEVSDFIYLFEGDPFLETTVTAEISEVSGFKALFGDPEINDASIVTFVVRNGNAADIIGKIEESLAGKGWNPIHRISETIGGGDSWAAVSVKVPVSKEKNLMSLYDKEYKMLDKTLSIGVYRVSEK
ncbi:hypothetical protein J5690_09785 [bacterium]|nr:hypothetical protein [bacterium]